MSLQLLLNYFTDTKKCISKCISNGISHPEFYGKIELKARKSRNDPSKLIKVLNKRISY